MKGYQAHLFEQLEAALEPYAGVSMAVQYNFSNVGTLMLMAGPLTVDSWRFDVQRDRVHILHRETGLGPRSGEVFWWNPSKPEDNEEVLRFMKAWTDSASTYVESKTTRP